MSDSNNTLYTALQILHLVSAIVWVGSVFMGTFVDWPAIRESMDGGRFPFHFIVGQGRRVFVAVYVGITSQIVSGVGLVSLRPPETTQQLVMLSIKGMALAFMVGATVYGTLVTWRKLQFATHAEAFRHYRVYMLRAMGTFVCGIVGSVLGHLVY